MNKEYKLDQIISNHLPAIRNGQESLDAVLEMFPEDSSALRPRLEAALWLLSLRKNLDPRPGFIVSSRKYLEQRIETSASSSVLRRFFARYSPQRWVFNLAAPVVLLIILVLVVNSLVLTSKLSIPGDPFYSAKLAIEDIQLAFASNPEQKTDLYVQFLHERTTEFVELVLDGDYDYLPSAASRMEGELIASLNELNNLQAKEPVGEIPQISEFRETLSSEVFLLEMLKNTSPPYAHEGIDLAIQVVEIGVMALR